MTITNEASTAEIMDIGINYLLEKLGTVDTERFISVIIREKSDYTKWRQQYFADIDSEEFYRASKEYGEMNPL